MSKKHVKNYHNFKEYYDEIKQNKTANNKSIANTPLDELMGKKIVITELLLETIIASNWQSHMKSLVGKTFEFNSSMRSDLHFRDFRINTNEPSEPHLCFYIGGYFIPVDVCNVID